MNLGKRPNKMTDERRFKRQRKLTPKGRVLNKESQQPQYRAEVFIVKDTIRDIKDFTVASKSDTYFIMPLKDEETLFDSCDNLLKIPSLSKIEEEKRLDQVDTDILIRRDLHEKEMDEVQQRINTMNKKTESWMGRLKENARLRDRLVAEFSENDLALI